MRGNAGFSLVELLIAIGIAAIIGTIATMQFSQMNTKSKVESELQTLFTDLGTIRSECMYQKRSKAVGFTSSSYSIYSSAVTTVPAVRTVNLKNQLLSNQSGSIVFDSNGLLQSAVNGSRSFCISTGKENGANVDAIVLSLARTQQGKWQTPTGGANDCKESNITFK